MKNGGRTLVLVCALSVAMVIGIFVGRNLRSDYAKLPQSSETVAAIATEAADYRLDINTASKVQLMELPGIGEVTAERIIAYREENGAYAATDDLMNVEGIGEKKLQQIEALIMVGG